MLYAEQKLTHNRPRPIELYLAIFNVQQNNTNKNVNLDTSIAL